MTAITWEQSPDRSTWLAQVPGRKIVLGVTRLGVDRWLPAVQDGQRGPVCQTRLEAQRTVEGLVRSR